MAQMDPTGRWAATARSADPHGHLRLGEIEFGRIIKDRLIGGAGGAELPVTAIDKDLGSSWRRPDPLRCRVHPRPGLRGGQFLCSGRSRPARCGHQPDRRRSETAAVRADDQSGDRPDADAARWTPRARATSCSPLHDPPGPARLPRATAPGPPGRHGAHDPGAIPHSFRLPGAGGVMFAKGGASLLESSLSRS